MKLRRPPKIAAWLIERNSPLAGDLLEEFQRGKSRGWFWRQALIAMAAGWGHNVRVSQLYLTALLIGFAAQSLAAVALCWLHLPPRSAGWAILFVHFFIVSAFFWCWVRHRIAGSAKADLRSLLTPHGEMDLRKRTAIARLVAGETFTRYLFLYCIWPSLHVWGAGATELLWMLLTVASVIFRRTNSKQIADSGLSP